MSAVELHIFTEPQQGASQEQLRTVAVAAERLGFAGFFRSDHLMAIGAPPRPPGPTESWASLADVAAATRRIRIGTLMTSATFRLPGPLAVAVAQVDQVSGGRVDFGFGAGWYQAEHLAYGIPFPEVGERMERFAEQLEIVRGIWSTKAGGSFSHQGRHYQLRDCPSLPRPAQAGGPPILIGGMGERTTPRLAARHAAEFNCAFVPPEAAGIQFDRVRRACAAIGRDPGSMRWSLALTVACGKDEREVARRCANIDRDPETLSEVGLAGTPERILSRLEEVAELGCQRAYLQLLDLGDTDHLELLAEQVLPQVR